MPVLVDVSEQTAAGRAAAGLPPIEAVLADALIDTAADCSVIRPGVAQRLGIEPVNRRRVRTPTSGARADERNVYDVSIILVHPQRRYRFTSAVEVVESSLGHADCEMLLGRDVLRNCLFILDGGTRFTIAF